VRLLDIYHKTFSNGKMVYILNVDIDEWNKLGIHDFSCWCCLGCRKLRRCYQNFEIQDSTGANSIK